MTTLAKLPPSDAISRAEALTIDDVIDLIRRECDRVGSQRTWAIMHDLSPAYVNDVLRGRRDPGRSIASSLGLQKVVSYRRLRP